MTKLSEKGLLSGSKTPHTTTGEMKEALGRLRDYLNELLGEDSADKETARQALGIDLKVLSDKIEAKADQETLEETMKNKVDQTLFESKTDELEQEIAKRGTPVGTIEFFAMTTPPAGYLRADGAEVGWKPGLNSLPLSGRRSVPEMGKRHSICRIWPDVSHRVV